MAPPRLLVLLAVALLAARLAVSTAAGDRQAQQWLHASVDSQALELQVSGSEAGLTVTGLRFRGCPQRSLRVLLLDGSQAAAAAVASTSDGALPAGARALDFDRTFDRASDSWTLTVALPAGAPRPARLDLLCHGCRAADEPLSGLLASRLLGAASNQQEGSVVAVVLASATLPAGAPAAAAAGARRLQAAATGGCTLTVAGTAYSFDACTDVDHPNFSARLSLKVYASVEAVGSGSRLRMALSAPGSQEGIGMGTGGWASVGLPARPGGGMAGANAAVVFPAGKGAEVAGYKLPADVLDYFPETINKAKGSFKLGDTAAELVKGELRAVFTIERPGVPAAAGPLEYIFAMGPMGDGVPGLDDHTLYGDPYGVGELQLKLASVPSPSPSPKPSPVPSPAPSPKPKQSPPPPEVVPPRVPSPVAAPLPAPMQPAPAPATAAVDGAAAPAAGVDSGCALQLGGANAAPQAFSSCSRVQGIGQEFWLLWREEEAPPTSGKRLLTIGMNASAPGSSYVSVGFPSVPKQMTGASAVILAACADCGGAGASIQQYYLGGTSLRDVQPGGQLPISNLQAAKLGSGHLVGSFQLEVGGTAGGTAGRRLLQLVDGTGLPLIFAAGPAAADGTPRRHIQDGYATLALLDSGAQGTAQGEGTEVTSETTPEENTSLRAAHAWLAAIGWGVFIPLGIVMARSFQDLEPAWFHLHRALQAVGFVMGCVALGLGFALTGEWDADSHLAVHRNLGVACTALGASQFSAIILRPAKTHKYRAAWRLWHAWVGRAAAAIAIANIYYGTIHIWDLGAWPWACYTAVLATIVAVSLGKDTSDWLRRRRQAKGAGSATVDATVQLAAPPRKSADLPAGAAGDVEAGAGGVGGRGGVHSVRVSAGDAPVSDSPHSVSGLPLKDGFLVDSATGR